MASKYGEPPTGGSNHFSTGAPPDVGRSVAAVLEVRDVADLDDRIEALVGGAA
ncbi:MAG: hypothetical protein ABEI57_01750 [Halapricum sp.]